VALSGLRETTGAVLWTNSSGVSSGFGGPSIVAATVYLGTSSGIFAFGL
jgi:hypothetical protein